MQFKLWPCTVETSHNKACQLLRKAGSNILVLCAGLVLQLDLDINRQQSSSAQVLSGTDQLL